MVRPDHRRARTAPTRSSGRSSSPTAATCTASTARSATSGGSTTRGSASAPTCTALRGQGVRVLFLYGGEPFLWHDGRRGAARRGPRGPGAGLRVGERRHQRHARAGPARGRRDPGQRRRHPRAPRPDPRPDLRPDHGVHRGGTRRQPVPLHGDQPDQPRRHRARRRAGARPAACPGRLVQPAHALPGHRAPHPDDARSVGTRCDRIARADPRGLPGAEPGQRPAADRRAHRARALPPVRDRRGRPAVDVRPVHRGPGPVPAVRVPVRR